MLRLLAFFIRWGIFGGRWPRILLSCPGCEHSTYPHPAPCRACLHGFCARCCWDNCGCTRQRLKAGADRRAQLEAAHRELDAMTKQGAVEPDPFARQRQQMSHAMQVYLSKRP